MRAHIVQGMSYGDEGKGRVTDLLVRSRGTRLVVRFNGGPQAAHNVVSPEGVHHTFSQFGSGTLAGAATHLSRFMLIDPLALNVERRVLFDKGLSPSVSIDPDCLIITPYHRILNQARELARGADRHGSVGLGVGEARRQQLKGISLTVRGLLYDEAFAKRRLEEVRREVFEQLEVLPLPSHWFPETSDLVRQLRQALSGVMIMLTRDALRGHEAVVLEGAQGFLLDETYGFAPYNSWTNCTFGNADTLLDEVACTDRIKVGVFRSYATRHGAGPFVTEDSSLRVREPHNEEHLWMGGFRSGHLDAVMASFACSVSAPDVLAVTHCDQLSAGKVAVSYKGDLWERRGLIGLENGAAAETLFETRPVYEESGDLAKSLELATGVPVAVRSFGPTAGQEVFREGYSLAADREP